MVPTVWGAYGCGVSVFINHLKILKLVQGDPKGSERFCEAV